MNRPGKVRTNRPGQGRRRKPIEQHIEDGTIRTYHNPATVPGPITNRPQCPPHVAAMDSAASLYFDQVCSWLETLGTLSESDSPTIEAYVEAYFMRLHTLALMGGKYIIVRVVGYQKDADGNKVRGPDGKPIPQIVASKNPLEVQYRAWLDQMNRYATQLGFSPTARAALIRNGPPADSTNRLDGLLGVFGDTG